MFQVGAKLEVGGVEYYLSFKTDEIPWSIEVRSTINGDLEIHMYMRRNIQPNCATHTVCPVMKCDSGDAR